jgi:hypothetical protein
LVSPPLASFPSPGFPPWPSNGEQHPYGVAFVPTEFAPTHSLLKTGDILVANFNNSNNYQGTGTTIMLVPTTGAVSTFFTLPTTTPAGGVGYGLSTALAILRRGFVIVGSVPSTDGTTATSNAGGLLVLDSMGNLLSTITDSTINGPWDMTVVDRGTTATTYVSNVFAGTVVRLELNVGTTAVTVASKTVIASGYLHRPDSMAFAVGPTGLVFDSLTDVLYVASTEDNAVYAVESAAVTKKNVNKGVLVYSDVDHLHGPLGLINAPNGHLLVTNSDVINTDSNQPSEIVEFTKTGEFVKELSVDPAEGGSFGLAVQSSATAVTFAAVDDNAGALIIWTLPP